jgi:DNA invertase Pin-like site-specific DNA recombinase
MPSTMRRQRIKSQAHAGWALIRSRYDDGGYSGGSTDRPDLQRLLDDTLVVSRNGRLWVAW